jgi:hypothetical protein
VDLFCSKKDCVEVTDKWKEMYIPTAFKTYVIYADCINKKIEIHPEPIHIHVATKCACIKLPCRK